MFSKLSQKSASGEDEPQQRHVALNDCVAIAEQYGNNRVVNSKYSILTFLPKNLFEQFSRPINFYFLMAAFIQLIPGVAPVSPITLIAPLAVAFTLTAIKEGLDDYQRHKIDAKTNSTQYNVIRGYELTKEIQDDNIRSHLSCCSRSSSNSSSVASTPKAGAALPRAMPRSLTSPKVVASEDIHIGDLIVLRPGEQVPCDVLLLASSTGMEGVGFCSTEALDGEADAKEKLCAINADKWLRKVKQQQSSSPRKKRQHSKSASRDTANTSESDGGSAANFSKIESSGSINSNSARERRTRSGGLSVGETKEVNENTLAQALQYLTGIHSSLELSYEEPCPNLTSFTGVLTAGDDGQPISLNINHLMLQSSVTRVTTWVVGLAIYTGNSTRVGMTKKNPPTKWARLDKRVNRLARGVVAFQLCFILVFTIMGNLFYRRENKKAWYLYQEAHLHRPASFFFFIMPLRYFCLGSLMIPISFKVTVDLSKYYIALVIGWDVKMYDRKKDVSAKANNTALVEDLGQVQFLLSDKTGTITDNRMVFKHLCTRTCEEVHGLARQQRQAMNLGGGTSNNKQSQQQEQQQSTTMGLTVTHTNQKSPSKESRTNSKNNRRVESGCDWSTMEEGPTAMLGRVLALCNTVSQQEVDDETGDPIWTSPSPDEIALVRGAQERGMKLLERTRHTAAVRRKWTKATNGKEGTNDVDGGVDDSSGGGDLFSEEIEDYRIVATIPFTSNRAKMSIIVERLIAPSILAAEDDDDDDHSDDEVGGNAAATTMMKPTGQYYLLTKGADERMLPLCNCGSSANEHAVKKLLDTYSSQGLRTLVFGYRVIPEEEIKDWQSKYQEASTVKKAKERDARLNECYDLIERNLELAGLSAVEDALQAEAPETIQKIRDAGVRVWMLTGDKLQTAKMIGQSSNLLGRDEYRYEFDCLDNLLLPSSSASTPPPSFQEGGPRSMGGRRSNNNTPPPPGRSSSSHTVGATGYPASIDASTKVLSAPNANTGTRDSMISNASVASSSFAVNPSFVTGTPTQLGHLKFLIENALADGQLRYPHIFGDGAVGKDLKHISFDCEYKFNDFFNELKCRGMYNRRTGQAIPDWCEEKAYIAGATSSTTRRTSTATVFDSTSSSAGGTLQSSNGGNYSSFGGGTQNGINSTSNSPGNSASNRSSMATIRSSSLSSQYGGGSNNNTSSSGSGYSVVLTGRALRTLTEPQDQETAEGRKSREQLLDHLERILIGASTVICCRVTPDQKALIVKLVKKHQGMTCAVGDGGNDVAMIQEAHVGVGIAGNEGRQAAAASDFCFSQFRFLQRLLLVHGHTAYQRTAFIVQFSFYKAMVIAICQLAFNCISTFSGASYFDSFSLATWNGVYTTGLTMFYVFDKHLPASKLLSDPSLYSLSQRGRYLNPITFFNFLFRAMWQGTVVWAITEVGMNAMVAINPSGFTGSQETQFIPTYSALLFVVVEESLRMSHSVNALYFFSMWAALVSYILFSSVFALFHNRLYLNFFESSLSPTPVLVIPLAFFCAIGPRWVNSSFVYWIFPSYLQLNTQALHRKSLKGNFDSSFLGYLWRNLIYRGYGYILCCLLGKGGAGEAICFGDSTEEGDSYQVDTEEPAVTESADLLGSGGGSSGGSRTRTSSKLSPPPSFGGATSISINPAGEGDGGKDGDTTASRGGDDEEDGGARALIRERYREERANVAALQALTSFR